MVGRQSRRVVAATSKRWKADVRAAAVFFKSVSFRSAAPVNRSLWISGVGASIASPVLTVLLGVVAGRAVSIAWNPGTALTSARDDPQRRDSHGVPRRPT